MDFSPLVPSFKALAVKHGLLAEDVRDLAKSLRGEHFSQLLNRLPKSFAPLHPWKPGEKSRWFQHSDWAHKAQDAFLSEWLADDAVARALFEASDFSRLAYSPLSLLMEEAMRRELPLVAGRVGAIVEASDAKSRRAHVVVFMDFFYRLGLQRGNDPCGEAPWKVLWGALGPRLRKEAARPQHWSGFFESPSGKVPLSQIVTDDIHGLGQLRGALDFCEEARPMLIAKLSQPQTHEALAKVLALRDAQACANKWTGQGELIADLLGSLELALGWGEAEWGVLRQAAREQQSPKNSSWRKTPRLDAWLEARDLRALVSESALNLPSAASKPAARL